MPQIIPVPKNQTSRQTSEDSTTTVASECNDERLFCKLGITATPTAAELIAELQIAHGDLIFHLSGGCCDGSAPMCFPKGEFMLGSVDVLVNTVCDCDFYIAESTLAYYQNSDIEIDVTPGRGASFSVEAPRGVRFMIRSTVNTVNKVNNANQ